MRDMRDIVSWLLLFGSLTLRFSLAKDVVTCVYTSWSASRRPIGRLEGGEVPAEYCTHLVYAYTSIFENKIFTLQPALDEKTNGGIGNIAKMVALKEEKPELRTLIGVGGWNAGGWIFSTMAMTPEGRKIFIQSVIDFCAANEMDGVWLDWLTPGVEVRGGAAEDRDNFGSLLSEMRASFDSIASKSKQKLIIGVTVSAMGGHVANYDAEQLNNAADLVYLITYDLAGYWNGTITHPSPIFNEDGKASVDTAVNMWLDAGINPTKMVVGIPTFARTYKVPNDTQPVNAYAAAYSGDGVRGAISQAPGFLYYSETCSRIQLGGYTVVRDTLMKVPYAYSADQVIMYEDEVSVKEKVDYVKGLKLAGVYMFAVDEDDPKGFCGSPFSLTRAAAATMNSNKALPVGSSQVSSEQRCVSADKSCKEQEKCLVFPTMVVANSSADLWCGEGVVCQDPISIVECPVPSGVKDPFDSKFPLFVTKSGKSTAVKCRPGLVSLGEKDTSYICVTDGILGRSIQEYNCPADTKFTSIYLKCVVSGTVVTP